MWCWETEHWKGRNISSFLQSCKTKYADALLGRVRQHCCGYSEDLGARGAVQSIIMAYSITPYVGMTLKKVAATLKVHKWHTRNGCVRLIKSLHVPYQALSSVSISNWTLAGEQSLMYQTSKLLKRANLLSSDFFFLLSFISPPRQHDNGWGCCNDSNMKEQHKSLGIVLTTYCIVELSNYSTVILKHSDVNA